MPIDWDSAADSVLGPLGPGGAAPKDQSRVGGAAAPTDWDAAANSALAPMGQDETKLVPMRGSVPSSWGAGSNFLDSLLLGYGKELGAFAPTPHEAMTGVLSDYNTRFRNLSAAQQAYRAEEPRTSALTEIAGGVLPTTAAMALGQEYAVAPLAGRIAAAAPSLGPALDVLGGSAGAYGKGAGPAALRTLSLASRGGIEGGVGSALQSHLGTDSTGEQTATGAAVGSVLNPLLGPAGARLASKIPSTAADAAQSAIRQGVPIRAGELPGVSPIVSTLDKVLSGAKNAPERAAFNRAVTTHAGLPSEEINQKWVTQADALNGGTMSRIAGAYNLDATSSTLNSDLAHLDATSHGSLTVDGYKKYSQLRDKLEADLSAGSVPGSVYQAWTGKGGLLENYAKDPELRQVIKGPGGLKDTIDDAWSDSIRNSGLPRASQDYTAWQQARAQYKVTRTIDEDVDEKTGEYNPQKLLSRIQARYGTAQKAGDFGDLGTAGQFIYKPEKPPAQQTHSLVSRFGLPTAALGGAALAGGAAHEVAEPVARMLYHDPVSGAMATGAAALGYGATKVANSVLSSPTYTKHLLDISSGAAKPWLRGVNPLIQGVSDVYNPRQ